MLSALKLRDCTGSTRIHPFPDRWPLNPNIALKSPSSTRPAPPQLKSGPLSTCLQYLILFPMRAKHRSIQQRWPEACPSLNAFLCYLGRRACVAQAGRGDRKFPFLAARRFLRLLPQIAFVHPPHTSNNVVPRYSHSPFLNSADAGVPRSDHALSTPPLALTQNMGAQTRLHFSSVPIGHPAMANTVPSLECVLRFQDAPLRARRARQTRLRASRGAPHYDCRLHTAPRHGTIDTVRITV
ncbi:hypothetical protein C8R46DRAFT_1109550 [Mycena filopes]|nr:hypothetical protein C8R46DRAFT_1109550 [Mycena filopes]